MTDTMLTLDGITQPITEWALDYGIYPAVITQRLERGWTVERAITTPMAVAPRQKLSRGHLSGLPRTRSRSQRNAPLELPFNGETLSISEWSKRTGIAEQTINSRLSYGWSIERTLTEPVHSRPSRRPGVGKNFAAFEGTGGGRDAQDISELEFSE